MSILLCRDVSQTPWTIEGAKRGRTSVQEEIERLVLPLLRCDSAKFITAGEWCICVHLLSFFLQNMIAASCQM